jgi:Ca2+ transporting ATPase
MNVYNTDKSGLNKKDLGNCCNSVICHNWNKDFTLEFSRDRKSMSVFVVPNKPTRSAGGAKMFAKVRRCQELIDSCVIFTFKATIISFVGLQIFFLNMRYRR